MVPVLVLAVVAFAFIRLLMAVVARDETSLGRSGGLGTATSDFATTQTYDPTMQLRSRVNDDARAFLLPAVDEPHVNEQPGVDESIRVDDSAGATDRERQVG